METGKGLARRSWGRHGHTAGPLGVEPGPRPVPSLARAASSALPCPLPTGRACPSLQVGNLGLLFMLLFFIYAALGVELFGKLGE